MIIKQLTPTLYVADQVTVDDMQTLQEQGFSTLINNRPDGEDERQPSAQELKTAAQRAGFNYFYQPVVGSDIGPDDVARFSDIIDRAQGKVLAHCRTGTRCTMLWVLSQSGKQSPDDILETASQAGYKLEWLRDQLI